MKKLLAIALLSLLGLFGWRVAHRTDDDGGRESNLLNRAWLDRFGQRETDLLDILVLAQQGRDSAGAFANASQWKMAAELFQFRAARDHSLQIRYPQTGETERVEWRIAPCHEDGFTVCLTLKGNSRGIRRYRSNDELIFGESGGATAGVDLGVVQAAIRRAEKLAR